MSNYIEILGITPASSFPKCLSNIPSNQICETDILCIPEQKPSIESILQVKADIHICSHEIICTCVGEKLVIEGVKHISIMYVADVPCQSVHSAHFDIPFCMFILLNENKFKVINIFTAIEDIKAIQLDSRHFSISLIIFACPEFNKNSNHCKADDYHCNDCHMEDRKSVFYKYKCKYHDDCEYKNGDESLCPSPCKTYHQNNTGIYHECNCKGTDSKNYCCGDYDECKGKDMSDYCCGDYKKCEDIDIYDYCCGDYQLY
ncbi:MAG: DUF3794 domain-containing protein [Sedimentibacter sp.]